MFMLRRIRDAMGQGKGLRELPALMRDAGASAAVLVALAAAAALPWVALPAAALVLLPVLLLTAVVFGRDSALLAALLAALAARLSWFGPEEGPVGLLPIVVLSGSALAVAALLEELRRSRTEAETAYLRSDKTARRAAERVEAARRQLRAAEARLAEAERKASRAAAAAEEKRASSAARASRPDPALEGAFRSEGGI